MLASYVKSMSLAKSVKFLMSGKPAGSTITTEGLTADQPSDGEKLYCI